MDKNKIEYEIVEAYDEDCGDRCVDFNIFYEDKYIAYYSQYCTDGVTEVSIVDFGVAKELFKDELKLDQNVVSLNIEVNKKAIDLLMEILGEHTDEFVDAVHKMRERAKAIDNML